MSHPKRPCVECGAPCCERRCRSCFKKDKGKTLSRESSNHRRKQRYRLQETIKSYETLLKQQENTSL